MTTPVHSRQIWPPVMVFSWRWLFYAAAAGALAGGVVLAVSDMVEGAAVATGIAIGLAIWLGYPLGLRAAVVLLWPVHRLAHMTQERIDWVISEYQIAMPEPSGAENVPFAIKLVAPALYLYAAAAVAVTMAAMASALFLLAGLGAVWNTTLACGGAALAGYAYIFVVVLWLRGRTELLARALRQGTQRAGRVAHSVNRRLHLA